MGWRLSSPTKFARRPPLGTLGAELSSPGYLALGPCASASDVPAPGKAVRHPRSPALAATKTEATLLVCWEASGSTLMPVESHVGLFFQLAVAADLNHGPPPAPGQNAFKMGFGGISTTQGIRGLCCAVGLADQVASVVERVRTLLQHHWHLAVTVVGASRGAVAGLMLARALEEADLGEGRIALHLCLIDPVPGNLIWVSRLLSPCKTTVTAACLDVSGCTCLRSVLALYPCEPLADCACHAPVLPSYPASCDVEEDATLGLHTDVVATAAGDSWTRHDRLSRTRYAASSSRAASSFATRTTRPLAAAATTTTTAGCRRSTGCRRVRNASSPSWRRRGRNR